MEIKKVKKIENNFLKRHYTPRKCSFNNNEQKIKINYIFFKI